MLPVEANVPTTTPDLLGFNEAPSDSGLEGLRIEHEQLLGIIETMRKVQALGPTAPPPGLNDADHGRWLAYETITTVQRNEAVMRAMVVLASTLASELARRNEVRAAEVELAREQRADAVRVRDDEREREGRRRNFLVKAFSPIWAWLGNIFADEKVKLTFAVGLSSLITGATTTWGPAFFQWLFS